MISKKELVEEKASEFELLRRDLESIDAQMQEINYRMKEFKSALFTISQIKELAPDHELIMPLSEGLMIKVNVKDPKKALIGIGNKVVVERNSDDCDSYIKERIDEADSLLTQLNDSAEKTTGKLRRLEAELMELTKKDEEEK